MFEAQIGTINCSTDKKNVKASEFIWYLIAVWEKI